MDEHHQQVERERSKGADIVRRFNRQMIQDRLLESVGLRIGAQGGLDVSCIPQRGTDLVRFRTLPLTRVPDVGLDGLSEFAADEVATDDVGDRPDGPEPLDAEETRKASGNSESPCGLLDRFRRDLRLDRQVPHDNPKPISRQVAELQGPVGPEGVEDVDVLELESTDRLWQDALEREQPGRHSMLVLGPRVPDSLPADVKGPSHRADEPVRLPIPDSYLR